MSPRRRLTRREFVREAAATAAFACSTVPFCATQKTRPVAGSTALSTKESLPSAAGPVS